MSPAGAPTAEETPRRAVLLALGLVLVGGTVVVALHNWLGLGGAGFDWVGDGHLGAVVVAAAALACVLRAGRVRQGRRAWLLIGASIFCWAGAEAYWASFVVGNADAPYPSPADALYLAFYPLVFAGLAMLVHAKARELDWRLWTDGLIAALGTAALGAVFVFDFVVGAADGSGLELAVTLAYPLADIALLALIVGVIALSGWRPDRVWSLLLAGLAALVVADIAYSLESSGGVVALGNWIDPLYLVSACFIGAVAWMPDAAPIKRRAGQGDRRVLMVPTVVAVPMIGLAAMQYVGGASALSTLLWVVTIGAIVGRLAVSVHENGELLERVRTDGLTGLGSRGAMQMDLAMRFHPGASDEPAAIVLLDLNGFKRYNDSFGHPAGDALLAGFGPALRAAVGESGAAYRTGGDEFCLLLTCPAEEFEAVIRRAAEALTARRAGVEVSASWGAATIPDEEIDPVAAMQLADVRMYAQKESRSLAREARPAAAVPPAPQPSAGTR